ncbi:MAG: WbuC family cupin fold metalloprotein [Acidimicrobiaceae bacterium]
MTVIRQTEKIARVTPDLIENLCSLAASSERGKSIALIHSDESDQVQEMLIALAPRTFVDRHCTNNQSESIFVIRGLLAMALFSENGEIAETLTLANNQGSSLFGLRLPTRQWQAYLTGAEVTVIHEIACGPFKTTNSEQWALDDVEVRNLKRRLEVSLSSVSNPDIRF